MFTKQQIALFEIISGVAAGEGLRVFVVGGTIRDIFLGQDPRDKDIDFIVEGNAIRFAEVCIGKLGGDLKTFEAFYTAKITGPADLTEIAEVDFASSRTERYLSPGELPAVTLAPIDLDLKRRDFAINAMAVPLPDLLNWAGAESLDRRDLYSVTLDPFHGMQDIEARIVRILHDQSFIDDPTRIFRACRYAGRLEGRLEDKTAALAREAADKGALNTISAQRRLNELKKIFAEKHSSRIIGLLFETGIAGRLDILPVSEETFFRTSFGKLDQICGVSDIKADAAIRILFAGCLRASDREGTANLFASYGFGKKQIKRFLQETETAGQSNLPNPQDLGDAALVFSAVLRENSPELQAECAKRGLTDGTDRES